LNKKKCVHDITIIAHSSLKQVRIQEFFPTLPRNSTLDIFFSPQLVMQKIITKKRKEN
jgi:hypothetical protein